MTTSTDHAYRFICSDPVVPSDLQSIVADDPEDLAASILAVEGGPIDRSDSDLGWSGPVWTRKENPNTAVRIFPSAPVRVRLMHPGAKYYIACTTAQPGMELRTTLDWVCPVGDDGVMGLVGCGYDMSPSDFADLLSK